MPSRVADILMEQGREAARAREQSGQMWGGVVAGLAHLPEQIDQQRQLGQEQLLRRQHLQLGITEQASRLRSQQEARMDDGLTSQLVQQHSKLDPDTGHVVIDHDAVNTGLLKQGRMQAAERYMDFGTKYEERLNDIQNKHLAMEHAKMKLRADVLGGIATAPEDQREGLYATARGSLSPLLQHDEVIGKLPPVYPGHEAITSLYNSTLTDEQRYARHTKAAEDRLKGLKEVPPGGKLVQVDPETGKVATVAEGAPKEKNEWETFKESYPKTLGAANWEALQPAQQQAGYSKYTTAKQDPAMAALAREMAQERLTAAREKREQGSQPKLEQQYRQVLARGLSSRSGGLGLEDSKVQQANHLIALLDQTYDPKSNSYNIPKVLQAELAAGLARLTAPGGNVGIEMMREFNQRTAKGDLAGALSYVTGTPFPTATQDIAKMLKDSILRQGEVAEQNREGEMRYLRGLAPTDLEEERRQKLEATSLNPLRRSRVIKNEKTGERKIQVSLDSGKTWQ